MPTYAFKDDEQHPDESNQNTAGLIRNWLGSSMDFFRVKKFSQKHAESTERRKQEKQAELDARAKYYKRFEEQKQKHSEAFFRERPKEITIHSTKYAAAGNELSNSWLEEYNHPSSTANVSIHEVMGVGEVHTERAKSKNNTSFADSSLDLSSSFNSTAKSLFSTSILGGNGIPGSTGSVQKLPTDQLETYTGSRPSFGITTLTSTPVAKLFTSGNSLKPSTLAFPVTAQQPKTVIVNKPPSLNKPETIIQKPQLNSIPEANDAVQEPTVNKIPSNSIEKAAENRKVETPVGQKKSFNNLVMYYSKDLDLKEDNDLAKDRFEKSGETALRGTIKRTINEKLVVCSKKHANPQELEAAVEFLSKMISGKTIKSHNGQKFQVTEEEAIAYIRDVVISYCMGVVERDNDLVHVLATILRGVSRQNSAFESVLLGHLFINSALLTLDQQICTKFAETVASNPGRRLTMYNKEKSTIKLFMALHLNTESGSGIYSRLDMRNLWRTIAIVCNSPPCVISTVVLSTLFLEICADKMGKIYSKQFTKLTNVMKEQLLPLLERNLQSSQLCQAAGEASLISVLCNGWMADDDDIEWIREEDDESKTLDITECERQLAAVTADTKILLNDMQEKAEKIDINNKTIHEDLAALRKENWRKTIEDDAQVPVVEIRDIPCPLPANVDAVTVGVGHLKNVAGVALLPGGNVLVADETAGLILFNFEGNVLKTLNRPEWKNIRSPIYHKEHVLFLADFGEAGRHIIKLTSGLDYVARIEGPRWLADRHVDRDRIAIAHTDCIYLTACGSVLKRSRKGAPAVRRPPRIHRRPVGGNRSLSLFGTFSAVYELSPVGQWSELDFKQSESFIDLVAFATIGPITQLLIIEGRRNYVIQLAIRESVVVDRRKMAVCERPGSLAKDEAGRLFVANYGVVALVDTIRWTAIKPVAVAGAPSSVTGLCALGGLLAIPGKDFVRLQRYSFR